MSVSGIGSGGANALYQWQNQRLGAGGAASGSGGKRSSAALSGYGSVGSQLSGMVELTRYAMDAMGLEEGSRVTFSQVTKYREQLNSEFNSGVREGLAALGVSDPTALAFTLGPDGLLNASGANAADAANAQTWLNAHADLGTELRATLTAAGVDAASSLTLRLDAGGALAAQDADADAPAAAQAALNRSTAGQTLLNGLASLSDLADASFTIQDAENGVRIESADPAVKEAVQRFFDGNPGLAKKFKQIEALSGLDEARQAMRISPSALRKRIEIESLAAWWAGSGNAATDGFGTFSDNGLSLLSGLNLSV